MRFALPSLLLLCLSSCTSIESLSDEELARYLQDGSKLAIQQGLQIAADKLPAATAAIKADAVAASELIKKEILPLFTRPTAEVLRSTVDRALVLLPARIKNVDVQAAVALGIDVLIQNVKLPDNPAQKLDDRTKKALIGFFTGLSEGVDKLGW